MPARRNTAAGVTVPGTKLARKATELVRDATSDLIYRPGRRVYQDSADAARRFLQDGVPEDSIRRVRIPSPRTPRPGIPQFVELQVASVTVGPNTTTRPRVPRHQRHGPGPSSPRCIRGRTSSSASSGGVHRWPRAQVQTFGNGGRPGPIRPLLPASQLRGHSSRTRTGRDKCRYGAGARRSLASSSKQETALTRLRFVMRAEPIRLPIQTG